MIEHLKSVWGHCYREVEFLRKQHLNLGCDDLHLDPEKRCGLKWATLDCRQAKRRCLERHTVSRVIFEAERQEYEMIGKYLDRLEACRHRRDVFNRIVFELSLREGIEGYFEARFPDEECWLSRNLCLLLANRLDMSAHRQLVHIDGLMLDKFMCCVKIKTDSWKFPRPIIQKTTTELPSIFDKI